MGVPFKEALANLNQAAKQLYRADPRVHAVGITRHDGGYGFRVVRNVRKIVANAGAILGPSAIQNIPVVYADAPNDAHSLIKMIPPPGGASPFAAPLVPEQQFFRPLVCGQQ